eukprot:1160552-Pelagomonas_calceolata.AAC.14
MVYDGELSSLGTSAGGMYSANRLQPLHAHDRLKLTPGCSRPTGAAHALKLDMQALQNLQGSPGGVKKAQESVAAAI